MSLVPSQMDQINLQYQLANMKPHNFNSYWDSLSNMNQMDLNSFFHPSQMQQQAILRYPENTNRPPLSPEMKTFIESYKNNPNIQPPMRNDLMPANRIGDNGFTTNPTGNPLNRQGGLESQFFGDHIANSIPRAIPQTPPMNNSLGTQLPAFGGSMQQPKPVAPKPQPMQRVSPGVYRNSTGALVRQNNSIPKFPMTKPASIASGFGNNIFNRAR